MMVIRKLTDTLKLTGMLIILGCNGLALLSLAQVVVPVESGEHSGRFVPDKIVNQMDADSAELIAVGRPAGPVREDIAIACGKTEIRHQAARRRSAARVGGGLTPAEIRLILDFLGEKLRDQSEYEPLALNAMKNDVSSILLRQQKPVEGYCNTLVTMYRNPDHDYVWRDYCLQFMFSYCEQFCSGEDAGSNAQIYAVYSCLQDAVKEVQEPIAGTALCGMAALSGRNAAPMNLDVAVISTQMAGNTNACVSARTTAIQVAAEFESRDILPLARRIAASTEDDAMLRLASIGAIGLIGEEGDIDFMNSLAESGDSRIDTAVRHARNRLNNKHK